MKNICIIGSAGFVGFTLSLALAEKGFKIFGIDINENAIKQVYRGESPFYEPEIEGLIEKHIARNLTIQKDSDLYEGLGIEMDAYIITVGTPLNKDKTPNFDYIRQAMKYVDPEKLVILRSTVSVGVTEGLKQEFGLKNVVFAPERTIEGKALEELNMLSQIIGADDNISFHNASKIFCKLSPEIIRCSIRQAELAKLLSNVSRDMVFGSSNILSRICQKHGEDYNKVIEIATRNYNRKHLYRTDFVSGSCLIKDSYLLTDDKKVLDIREFNENLVNDVLDWIEEHIQEKSKIVVSGLAFKGRPPTDDLRDSHAVELLRLLRKYYDYEVVTHDFMVNPVDLYKACEDAKLLLILNNNSDYKKLDLSKIKCYIFDSANVLESDRTTTLGNFLIED